MSDPTYPIRICILTRSRGDVSAHCHLGNPALAEIGREEGQPRSQGPLIFSCPGLPQTLGLRKPDSGGPGHGGGGEEGRRRPSPTSTAGGACGHSQRGWGWGSLSQSADLSGRRVKVPLAPSPPTWGLSVRTQCAGTPWQVAKATGFTFPKDTTVSMGRSCIPRAGPRGSDQGAASLQKRGTSLSSAPRCCWPEAVSLPLCLPLDVCLPGSC